MEVNFIFHLFLGIEKSRKKFLINKKRKSKKNIGFSVEGELSCSPHTWVSGNWFQPTGNRNRVTKKVARPNWLPWELYPYDVSNWLYPSKIRTFWYQNKLSTTVCSWMIIRDKKKVWLKIIFLKIFKTSLNMRKNIFWVSKKIPNFNCLLWVFNS